MSLFSCNSSLKNVRVAIFFKDFAHWVRSSCVGLNVAGYTTAKYLRQHGIHANAYAVRNNIDVVREIDKYQHDHGHPLTHVIISAAWLTLHDLKSLVSHYRHINFVVLSHSNIGFLQADPNAILLFRKFAKLSEQYPNLKVGGNNKPFVEWFNRVYNYEHGVYLPNLYPVGRVHSKVWNGGLLKIGAFGAIRPEKNFMTAAAAAMIIHSRLWSDMELHMSTGGDGCKSTTLPAIEEMVEGVKGVKLVRHNWQHWDNFIKLIGSMDLLLQVSYTESFNMITADGISVGVPSVVSPVIKWAPERWKADPDNAVEVASVGLDILAHDQGYRGADALLAHDRRGLRHWKKYLSQHYLPRLSTH